MAPNTVSEMEPIIVEEEFSHLKGPQADSTKRKIVYTNIFTHGSWHLAGLYGLYLCFTSVKWATIVFAIFILIAANFGVTAGAHRLWSHKSFKAKLPLQILLMLLHTMAMQNTVFTWTRDHRMHHKYADTDADPHNATRGLFYSHMGWMFVKKHPEVLKRGKTVDLSDLYKNPVLQFQKKYMTPLIIVVGLFLPVFIPIYFWGESLNNSWHVTFLRYIVSLHSTFLVNSIAHKWGYKPYDKNIIATINHTSNILTFGEGFHNYHHVFPWDYRSSELGSNKFDLTKKFIDFFAWIGWAYDLKITSKDQIKMRAARTGDDKDESEWNIGWNYLRDTKKNVLMKLQTKGE